MSAHESRASRYRILRTAFLNVWVTIGVIIILWVALQLLGMLSNTLLFLSVGAIAAFVASPIANLLERHHVPRGVGALAGIIVVIVAVALLFIIAVPLVIGQFVDLLQSLPAQFSALTSWIGRMEREYAVFERLNSQLDLNSLVDSARVMVNGMLSGLLAAVRDGILPMVNNIASTVFTVFLGIVLAYWLVLDYPRINEEICTVLGEDKAVDFRLVSAVLSRSVGGYMRSTLINSVIQGVLAAVGFMIVGHPYAGVMGVLSGILNIIPVVGPSISAAIATLIALFYSPAMAFWTLIVAMVSQNVTDNVIAPKINQSTMQVHPVLSLTALVIGSTLGGTIGMVIALPIAAVVKSLFIFYYESRTGQQIVSYEGALFKGSPFVDEDGDPVPAFDALGDDGFVSDSQIIDDKAVPKAVVLPKPELENPWAKLRLLEFDIPFAPLEREDGADRKDAVADPRPDRAEGSGTGAAPGAGRPDDASHNGGDAL